MEKMEKAGVSKNPATRLNSWNVKRFSRNLSNPFSFRTNATEGAPFEIPSASKEKRVNDRVIVKSSVSSQQFSHVVLPFAFNTTYGSFTYTWRAVVTRNITRRFNIPIPQLPVCVYSYLTTRMSDLSGWGLAGLDRHHHN